MMVKPMKLIRQMLSPDMDDDDYGNSDNRGKACSIPTAHVLDSSDCDDTSTAWPNWAPFFGAHAEETTTAVLAGHFNI